jgi:hypothetical protein
MAETAGRDGRAWTDGGENILSKKNLEAVERHLETVGPVVVQHWHYYGARAPTRLVFEGYEDFRAYLDTQVSAGDAIDVWPFPTEPSAAIAYAKYPDSEGRVPVGGAY